MTSTEELRLYCVLRADLGDDVPQGKLYVQTGHAFVSATLSADPDTVSRYMANEQPKIVLKAKNEAAIHRAAKECQAAGINHYVVVDLGRTVFPEPTTTCVGLGPITRGELPKFIAQLQLMG
jgi:peptidyl-tRNA hydrolase